MAHISDRDFDLVPANRPGARWSYRKALGIVAGLCCISWATIILVYTLLFH